MDANINAPLNHPVTGFSNLVYFFATCNNVPESSTTLHLQAKQTICDPTGKIGVNSPDISISTVSTLSTPSVSTVSNIPCSFSVSTTVSTVSSPDIVFLNEGIKHKITQNNNEFKLDATVAEYFPGVKTFLKTKQHSIQQVHERYGYDPNPTFRAKSNIRIQRISTERSVPNRIYKRFSNLYRYIDKTTALQLSNGNFISFNDGKIKILSYDFYDKNTKEILYCVLKKEHSSKKRAWVLKDALYTAEEILHIFHIQSTDLPLSVRSTFSYALQLNHHSKVRNIINNKLDKKLISRIQWHKLPINKRQNNKKRLTVSFNKNEFIKSLLNSMQRDRNNIRLVDILMFDNSTPQSKKYRIFYVWIVRIDENRDIGISFMHKQQNDSVAIHDIHLDKAYLLEQHELVNREHKCNCLDDFISDINDLTIGNPDQHKNLAKDCRRRMINLKSMNSKLQKENAELQKQLKQYKSSIINQQIQQMH